MFYYIFKVSTNRPEIVPDYYILNNQYIGYILTDVDTIRSILEQKAKIENTYQLYATGHTESRDVHELNCDSHRFTKEEIEQFVLKYPFKLHKDKTLYKVYFPDKNSANLVLRSLDGTRIIS